MFSMQKQTPKLLICDFDGCLFPFPPNFIDVFKEAMGHTGHEISGGTWPHDTALQNIMDSFRKHGFGFKTASEKFNMSMGEANLIHHRNITFDLARDEPLIDAFKGIDRKLVFPMILTQGSRCNLDRHLPKIGIENEIPRNMRVTVDDHGYDRLKSNSEYPWQFAKWRAEYITGLKFEDSDIYVFEDSPKNLIIPDQLGWNTAFIHHGKPQDNLPGYIHRQEDSVANILNELPQRSQKPANHLTASPDLG